MHTTSHPAGPHPRRALWTMALVLCTAFSLQSARGKEPPARGEPVFTGLLIDGKTVSGALRAISTEKITLEDEDHTRDDIAIRSLVKLERELKVPVRATEGANVLLGDGDRLMRVVVGPTTDTTIQVEWHAALGKLTIPIDSVLGVVLTPPADSEAFDELWNRLRREPRTAEVAWLVNGDRMTGGFLGMNDHAVTLQVDGKPVEMERAGIIALGFDPSVIAYPRPAGDFLDLTLTDGSKLGVTAAKLEKEHVLASTRFGQSIRVPVSDLLRIDPRTTALVYLSDRKPDGQSIVPYLGLARPFQIDRTVEGHSFRLGGRTYERGIGTQSRTLLAYKIQPGDKRFQALVGVDERAGPLGSVVFRVLADGKPVVTTPSMTASDAPHPIDLDVSQVKILILATEFGDRGDVRDLADWVEARILR